MKCIRVPINLLFSNLLWICKTPIFTSNILSRGLKQKSSPFSWHAQEAGRFHTACTKVYSFSAHWNMKFFFITTTRTDSRQWRLRGGWLEMLGIGGVLVSTLPSTPRGRPGSLSGIDDSQKGLLNILASISSHILHGDLPQIETRACACCLLP